MNHTEAYECYNLIKNGVDKNVPTSLVAELESAFQNLNVEYIKIAIKLYYDNNGRDYYPSVKSLRKSLFIMKRYAEDKIINGNAMNIRNLEKMDKGEKDLEETYELGPWIDVVNTLGAYFRDSTDIVEWQAMT